MRTCSVEVRIRCSRSTSCTTASRSAGRSTTAASTARPTSASASAGVDGTGGSVNAHSTYHDEAGSTGSTTSSTDFSVGVLMPSDVRRQRQHYHERGLNDSEATEEERLSVSAMSAISFASVSASAASSYDGGDHDHAAASNANNPNNPNNHTDFTNDLLVPAVPYTSPTRKKESKITFFGTDISTSTHRKTKEFHDLTAKAQHQQQIYGLFTKQRPQWHAQSQTAKAQDRPGRVASVRRGRLR